MTIMRAKYLMRIDYAVMRISVLRLGWGEEAN